MIAESQECQLNIRGYHIGSYRALIQDKTLCNRKSLYVNRRQGDLPEKFRGCHNKIRENIRRTQQVFIQYKGLFQEASI